MDQEDDEGGLSTEVDRLQVRQVARVLLFVVMEVIWKELWTGIVLSPPRWVLADVFRCRHFLLLEFMLLPSRT